MIVFSNVLRSRYVKILVFYYGYTKKDLLIDIHRSEFLIYKNDNAQQYKTPPQGAVFYILLLP